MFRVALFLLCAVPLLQAEEEHPVHFCTTKYVKPGDGFKLTCSTTHGIKMEIASPHEDVPPNEELAEKGDLYRQLFGDIATSASEEYSTSYEDANKADHAGWYTCIVYFSEHHGHDGPSYSTERCEVIIVDLCEGVVCRPDTVCVGDYSTGDHSCVCDVHCVASNYAPVCADDCTTHISECTMRQRSCSENVEREVMLNGFCPDPRIEPVVNQLPEPEAHTAILGEKVYLSSGVVSDGAPPAQVTWTFIPSDSGERSELPIEDTILDITATASSSGTYIAEVKHCAVQLAVNTYHVQVVESPTTTEPADFGSSSPAPTGPDNLVTYYHVCSAFPGGVVESFSGNGVWYDLACTHVLAADVMTGGDYTNPWFIYGTFDEYEGTTSLAAMTFFIGSQAFEFQRGWVINLDGSQFAVVENVITEMGESGCFVEFRDNHLQLSCDHFEAYYDGIMSGHIRIKYVNMADGVGVPKKGKGNFGLCYDGDSGWRKNWQVGPTEGRCTVSTDDHSCQSTTTDCDEYAHTSRGKLGGLAAHTWCEAGPVKSCIEINCGDETASAVATCALQQAARVMCALRYANPLVGSDDKCPEDECVWKNDILSRGCPHENPPFVCV